MLRWILLFLLVGLLPLTRATAEDEEYTNPMTLEGQYAPIHAGADDYGIGDPFVLRHNGRYYLYASSCEERVRVYTSRDLVHWRWEGYCTEGRDVYFAYAPEVVYWRGSFYMITSPGGGGHYILQSDSPLGIFRPVTGNFGYSIDGSFFKLDDGRLMMLFPHDNIIKSSVLDEATMLPKGNMSSTGANLRGWTEGPGLFRRGDWYYLTFTGNHTCSTGYQVSFASRKGTPQGVYEQRSDATILINSVMGEAFKGLGHSANVIGPDLDSMYTTYHSLVNLVGPARRYNLDRLLTNGGLLYTTGPSNWAMPLPAMPDVYGDAAEELHDFIREEAGFFAEMTPCNRFTQECNFTLNGGTARWVMGQVNGSDVTTFVDVVACVNQTSVKVLAGEALLGEAVLPEIGPADCLHTLRVEHTPEVLYLYVDGMRVLTLTHPGMTARRVGALQDEHASYAFMACTAQALGSGDNAALKTIPGGFSAIHALNADELAWAYVGDQEEKAPILGKADYPVRVAADGTYAFDLTVRTADAGKRVTLLLDGENVWESTIPGYEGKEALFAFTTLPMALKAGDHLLTIEAEDVLVNRVESFTWTAVEPLSLDFTSNAFRDRFYTLGAFNMKPSEGTLSIGANKTGFAIFGEEGYTDMALDVRFRLPDKGSGSSGMVLRATDVSLYEHQVADSYFGYSLTLSRLGLGLRRVRYGASGRTEFVGIPAWQTAEEATLHIELRGGQVTISLPGEEKPLLSIRDAKPFSHGLYGFFSTGKELTVLECSASPLP